MTSFELEGRVALVTGGGRNLGRAICLALARHGADVVVNVRSNSEEGRMVADSITAMGRRSRVMTADIGDAAATDGMIQSIVAEFGSIDVLVNNATYRPHLRFLDMDDEVMRRMFDVTLFGAVNTCRSAIPHMLARGFGNIVNISGTVVHLGTWTHLATAKSGVHGLTRGIAKEFGPSGIRANTVEPSTIDTVKDPPQSQERADLEQRMTPLGRIAKPQEVADVCVFLASDMSSFITGQTIHVNGGQLMP